MKLVIRCGICGAELFSTALLESLPEEKRALTLTLLGLSKTLMGGDEGYFRYYVAFTVGLRHLMEEHPDKLRELFRMEAEVE
jgi:hypothetical protein